MRGRHEAQRHAVRVDESQPLARVPARQDHRGRADEQRRHHVAARTRVVRRTRQQVHVLGEPAPQRDLTLLRQSSPARRRTCRARRPSAGPSCPTCRRPGGASTSHGASSTVVRRRRPRSACPRGRGRRRAPWPASPRRCTRPRPAFRCVFTSTTEPCSFATAAHTSKNATEFGSMIATRSPTPTPRAARPRRDEIGARVEVDVRGGQVVLDERGLSGVRAACALGPNSGGIHAAERRSSLTRSVRVGGDHVDADEIAQRARAATASRRRDVRRDVARAGDRHGARATGTAIYFLLRAGERSHWHRVDATEIWHHYAGDRARAADECRRSVRRRPACSARTSPPANAPQLVVPPGRVAGRAIARRVDARGLHRLARVRVRRLRAGADRAGNRREA